jgi:mannosyltransferase OCH1-like enzyme
MEYINSKEKIKNAVNSWKKHSDFEYNFYDDAQCEEFIKNNFDSNVYEAYMKCPMNVMKADLWRYCVIYKYGGIYAV